MSLLPMENITCIHGSQKVNTLTVFNCSSAYSIITYSSRAGLQARVWYSKESRSSYFARGVELSVRLRLRSHYVASTNTPTSRSKNTESLKPRQIIYSVTLPQLKITTATFVATRGSSFAVSSGPNYLCLSILHVVRVRLNAQQQF